MKPKTAILWIIVWTIAMQACNPTEKNRPVPNYTNTHEYQAEAETYLQEGIMLSDLNNFDEALTILEKAYSLAKTNTDTMLQARCLEAMASINLDLGKDDLAMNHFYEALSLFEKTNHKPGMASVYNVLGGFNATINEFAAAEDYFLKAMQINEELHDFDGMIHNKANLAFMYQSMGRNDEAKELYSMLTPELIAAGDSTNLAVVYYYQTMMFQSLEQPDSSLKYIYKALEIAELQNDVTFLPTLHGMTGMVLLEKNDLSPAKTHLLQALRQAEDIEDEFTQMQVQKLLLAIDTLTGNYKQAIRRYNEIIELNDTLYIGLLRTQLETADLRYKNQQNSNQIEMQAFQLAATNKRKHLLTFISLLSVFSVMLLTATMYLLRLQSNRKYRLVAEEAITNQLKLENLSKTEEIQSLKLNNAEKEITIKEKEQLSYALALEQKNDLLTQINNKINGAMSRDGIITIQELNGIVSAIKTQIHDENLFNQKFSHLHANFFDDMKKVHPDLTKTELKFCAYIRLHLSGKQIASITNVTTEAIRKNRYRIRKKLNLQKDDSLEAYIFQF